MGNRVLAGRTLTLNDAYQRTPVVVISEKLAREYFKTPSAALGKRIRNSPQQSRGARSSASSATNGTTD